MAPLRRSLTQVFEGLTVLDVSAQVQPALAESWRVEADGQRIVFELRDGLTFSDGTPLTAEDVRRSWLRVIDPANPSPLSSLLDDVAGAAAYARGEGSAQDVGIHADGLTLTVDFERPAAFFPAVAAVPSLAVVPPTIDQQTRGPRDGLAFTSSGAYVPVDQELGQVRLRGNRSYWAGMPPLEHITVVTDGGGRSSVDIFEDEAVDWTPISPFDASWIRYDRYLGPQLRHTEDMAVEFLGFDTTAAPFDDAAARRAVAMAVDWRRLASSAMVRSGRRRRSCHRASPGTAMATTCCPTIPRGASRAGDSRLPRRRRASRRSRWRPTASDRARPSPSSCERELGIEVDVEQRSFDEHSDLLDTDTPPMWTLAWNADYPHAHDFLGLLLRSGSSANVGGWSDPEYDALIDAAAATGDAARAGTALRRGTGHRPRRGPGHPARLRRQLVAEPGRPRGRVHLRCRPAALRRSGLGQVMRLMRLRRRAFLAVGLVLATLLTLTTSAGAQPEVEFGAPQANGAFGEIVTFRTTFASDAPPIARRAADALPGESSDRVSIASWSRDRAGDLAGLVVPGWPRRAQHHLGLSLPRRRPRRAPSLGPSASTGSVDDAPRVAPLDGDHVTVWWHEGSGTSRGAPWTSPTRRWLAAARVARSARHRAGRLPHLLRQSRLPAGPRSGDPRERRRPGAPWHPHAVRSHRATPDRFRLGGGAGHARACPPRLRRGRRQPLPLPAALAQRGPGRLPHRGATTPAIGRRSRAPRDGGTIIPLEGLVGQFPTRAARSGPGLRRERRGRRLLRRDVRRGARSSSSSPRSRTARGVDEAFVAATGATSSPSTTAWLALARRGAAGALRSRDRPSPVPCRMRGQRRAPCYADVTHVRPRATRPRYGHTARRQLRRRPHRAPPRPECAIVKSGRVDGLSLGETEGFGVRVLVDGAWGFASSGRMDGPAADEVAALAVRIARASARVARRPGRAADRPPALGRYETPVEEDPFEVPHRPTVDMLLEAERAMAAVKGTTTTSAGLSRLPGVEGALRHRWLAHRAGHHPRRCQPRGQCRRAATTCNVAAIPESGGYHAAGYEHVRGLDLLERAPVLAEEAVELLSAPVLPPGRRTIVLHPSQLYLQIHEICGHPTELDRVFGTEAAYAGTSFLTTDKLEAGFRYGSDQVTLVADATTPGGLGTFGWDDEGVIAQRVPLVQRGHLQRLPFEPRDGAADRPRQRRGHARRRLEPAAAHPHDQHQPRAAAGHELRGHHRRHRRRPAPGEQPQLVHRRPASQLPVRRRGRS